MSRINLEEQSDVRGRIQGFMTVEELLDCVNMKTELQRRKGAWTGTKLERKFIDAVLDGKFIPHITLMDTGNKKYDIIDGLQRTNTLQKFRENGGSLKARNIGKAAKDYNNRNLTQLLRKKIPVIISEKLNEEGTRDLFTVLNKSRQGLTAEEQRRVIMSDKSVMKAIVAAMVPTTTTYNLMYEIFGQRPSMKKKMENRCFDEYIATLLLAGKRYLRGEKIVGSTNLFMDVYVETESHQLSTLKKTTAISKVIKELLDILNLLHPLKDVFSRKGPKVNTLHTIFVMSFLAERYKEKPEQVKNAAPRLIHFLRTHNNIGIENNDNKNTQFWNDKLPKSLREIIEIVEVPRRFTDKQKETKLKEQQDKCAACNNYVSFGECEADHIKPYSKGGDSSDSNLQVLCKKCNRKKGNKYIESTGEGNA